MKKIFISFALIIIIAGMAYGEERCTEAEDGNVRLMGDLFGGSLIYTVEQCMCAMVQGGECPFRWTEIMPSPTTSYDKALKVYKKTKQKNDIIKKRNEISKLKWKQVKP